LHEWGEPTLGALFASRLRLGKGAPPPVDEAPDVAMKYQVMSIPTLIVFKDGVEVNRLVGARGKAQLLESLAAFL